MLSFASLYWTGALYPPPYSLLKVPSVACCACSMSHDNLPPPPRSFNFCLCLSCAYVCDVFVLKGYYIFNEPLKQAVIEVKAKEARERSRVAEGGRSIDSSSVVSRGGGGSGGGDGVMDDNKPRGVTVGGSGSNEVDR